MDNDFQSDTPKKPNYTWIWWVVLGGLFIWNLIAFLPKSQPAVTLPYTTFLNQVTAGNVSKVTITGSKITGTFIKAVTWPPAGATTSTVVQGTVIPSGSVDNTPPGQYSDFATNFPDAVGDPNLMPLLEAKNVEVNVETASPWVGLLISNGLPLLLLLGAMIWLGRSASRSQQGVFSFGRSKPRQYVGDHPTVTFADVAGADEAKQELTEIVDFLRNPKKYHDLGARIPHGVLLVGPPGTGKTLLARAVSGEAGVPFFSISASEFVEMFVGVGASRVRDLFDQALKVAPAIVFIDEMDAVGRRRGAGLGTVNDEREQTLNQLLVEMDGFDMHHELIVLAATNRPDVLDPALLRPGRFDRSITVGLPDIKGREGILRIHTKSLHLGGDVNLSLLARTTTGFSGADLANLCNEAALNAARENHTVISMVDFEEALDRVLLGAARTVLLNDHDRHTVAYHEAGHALVAWLTPAADPVHKVTIIPRGRALGVTEQLPGEDHYNLSKEYLIARLAVMLGGRSSEEIALDDITTGAENDLSEATKLARHMITRLGMGNLGLMSIEGDENAPFLGYELTQPHNISDETAAQIDQNVKQLLEEIHQNVKQMLVNYRPQLDQLVQALLQEETINEEGLMKILGDAHGISIESTNPVEARK
jgi:cell division protease FtsH